MTSYADDIASIRRYWLSDTPSEWKSDSPVREIVSGQCLLPWNAKLFPSLTPSMASSYRFARFINCVGTVQKFLRSAQLSLKPKLLDSSGEAMLQVVEQNLLEFQTWCSNHFEKNYLCYQM